MTNDELKDIFKYLDSFCVVNLMLIRANPNTISLDEVIFQDNKKIKIQKLVLQLLKPS
jgi:hypothetical protein